MPLAIGTREELMVNLRAAVKPGEPTRLLVVFRLGGFSEFVARYGYEATDALMTHVASRLPDVSGPSTFYHRPRKNELCALIGGRIEGVEGALAGAARDVHDTVESSGITLGFGTAVIPQEADDPVAALALADSRMTGVVDAQPVPRDGRSAPHATARVGVLKPAG